MIVPVTFTLIGGTLLLTLALLDLISATAEVFGYTGEKGKPWFEDLCSILFKAGIWFMCVAGVMFAVELSLDWVSGDLASFTVVVEK